MAKKRKHRASLVTPQDKLLAMEAARQVMKERANARQQENEKAFLYMLAIPLNVLACEDYWGDDAKEKAPAFIEEVVSLYEAVQNGNVSNEELSEFLWEYAGVTIDAEWLQSSKNETDSKQLKKPEEQSEKDVKESED